LTDNSVAVIFDLMGPCQYLFLSGKPLYFLGYFFTDKTNGSGTDDLIRIPDRKGGDIVFVVFIGHYNFRAIVAQYFFLLRR
jgi:hypothetical protein